MGVAAEIIERLARTAKRRLRADHPFAVFQRAKEVGKGEGVLHRLDGTGKPEFLPIESVFESLEEQAAEEARKSPRSPSAQ
jgi:hypothetical protein